ncbi:MAG: hypothetical protein ACFFC6_03465 [Promethearchaeota archaeon]
MLVPPPDKLQTTLDYLNYTGVVFYRDSERLFSKEKFNKGRKQPHVSDAEKFQSENSKIPRNCLLCTKIITNNEYKQLGKRTYLCSTCKPLFAEITII